jgi:hypothetical protein
MEAQVVRENDNGTKRAKASKNTKKTPAKNLKEKRLEKQSKSESKKRSE